MKDIGLVGVPFSGKSTLFTAVTRAGSHAGQANLAVVPVPDPRVDVLTRMERSAKTVYAQVRFVDVPGGLSSAQGVARLREADALAVVVRCFGTGASPASELAGVRADLLLADLAVIESALQKAEKKARGKPGPDVAALHAAKDALDAEASPRSRSSRRSWSRTSRKARRSPQRSGRPSGSTVRSRPRSPRWSRRRR